MPPTLELLLFTTIAGLAMPTGALLARIEHFQSKWLEQELRHSVIAFGGGILLAAVALVLVPEATKELSTAASLLWFAVGGLLFMLLAWLLNRSKSSAAQLTAMLADFIPEAIALGASYATGSKTGMLLALFITLQNLPEGFNAYRELRDSNAMRPTIIIAAFAALALLGPLAAILGYTLLDDKPHTVAAIMLVAASGILYLTFEDIAPQAHLDNQVAPPIGAVLGFLFGLAGHLLITPA
jgi:ZIP family zinc transporter